MPATSLAFWEALSASDLPNDALKGVNYHAFGLGDDQDDDKYDTAFEEWLPEFFTVNQAPEPKNDHLIPPPLFDLRNVSPDDAWEYKAIQAPGTKSIQLDFCKRITPIDYDRIIYHLQFDLVGTDFSYLLGDALNVYPKNDPEKVRAFLESYKIKPQQAYRIMATSDKVDKRRLQAYRRP